MTYFDYFSRCRVLGRLCTFARTSNDFDGGVLVSALLVHVLEV
jgi:hypothetical protein